MRGAEWCLRIVWFVNERIHPTIILEAIMPEEFDALEFIANRIPLLRIPQSVEGAYGEGIVVASPVSIWKYGGFSAKLKRRVVLGLKVRESLTCVEQTLP